MSYLMHLIPQAYERTTELQPLRPLTIYPILPSAGKESSKPSQEKKGQSLMPNYALESKVNKLYDLLVEIEEINTGDDEIDWCVSSIKDYTKSLMQIAQDYHVNREYAY